jgi:alpha-1,2-mannosyltransferase
LRGDDPLNYGEIQSETLKTTIASRKGEHVDTIHEFWHSMGLPPALRRFLVLLVVSILLIIGVMCTFFSIPLTNTELSTVFKFVTVNLNRNNDSWEPMVDAINYLQSPHQQLLYDKIFFTDHIKFQYPPTSLLFIQPFKSVLGMANDSVFRLLNIINWVGIIAISLLSIQLLLQSLRKYLPDADKRKVIKLFDIGLLILLCLFFYPIMYGYSLGQIQVWIDLLFTLICFSWLYQKKRLSGSLVAVLCLIKPQYGLIILWGLFRREWKFVRWAVAILIIGGLISILTYGLDNNLDYLKTLSYISQHGEGYYPNNSVNGILNRFLFNGNNVKWDAHEFAPYNPIVYYGTLISTIGFIGLALFLPRRARGSIYDFFIIALSSTMASPVAWEHHYGILFPIFMFLIPLLIARKPLGRYTMLFFGMAYVLCTSFLPVFNLLATTRLNILEAYLFWGALIVLFTLYIVASRSEGDSLPAVAS